MPNTNLLPFAPREESLCAARTGFEHIPADLSKAELFRYFTYSAADRHAIFECRGRHNKVGFALLLGGVRLTGRFPLHFHALPDNLLAQVCQQWKVGELLQLDYAQRAATLHTHKERLREYLGLRYLVAEEQADLILACVREEVRTGRAPDELTERAEEHLRALHFILPGVTVLQKLVSAALTQTENELYRLLGQRLTDAEKTALLALLILPTEQKTTPFQQLQQTATRPSPEALARELDHLEQVRGLLPEKLDLSDLPSALLERWARLTSGLPTRSLQRYAEDKRLALLLCWLWRLRTQLIDTALTVGNELVAGVLRRAQHSYERVRQEQQKRMEQALQLCGQIMTLLLDEAVDAAELRATLYQRFSRERLTTLQNDCQELAAPAQQLYVEELRKRYSYVRQFAPRLLETFALRAEIPSKPLREAVAYLRARNQSGLRGLDEKAPLDFIPAKWKPLVSSGGVAERAVWEVCLLSELRLLDEEYPRNAHLQLTDGALHLERLEKSVTPDSALALKTRLRQMLQRRHLSDLLLEVQHWTNFLSGFTRLSSGRPLTAEDTAEQIKLLTCLIGAGCNIGFSEMSILGPGLREEQLAETQANYVRPETLQRATARLVNFHLQQWLPAAWGQGFTSSSDAAVYQVPVRALNATFHPKYFASAGRGVAVYTHVSDLWIPFYTQVITCHVRQAPYILDGLLQHGTLLNLREHYTDTHGYTDLIFGITHLLGIRFAPRIKDLPDQRLWRLPDSAPYQHIEPAVSNKLNVQLMRESWDEMLRLAASLKYGAEKASLIVSKLAAASHRNKLFRGLQELGRLVKTTYLAEYFRDIELRRRVLLGLNKGESLHSLARKVFFGSLGEVRDRTYEDQLNAASSLNLLLAAIVCWNTVHLQACIRKLRAEGVEVKAEDLRFLSPLLRHHIGIYGQYSFDFRRFGDIPAAEDLSY